MIVDGRQIASDLREVLERASALFSSHPTLGIVIVGENPVIESFVRIKKKYGESIGVSVVDFRFPADIHGEVLREEVRKIALKDELDGIVIQLPLPAHIDVEAILNVVPHTKDLDVLSRESIVLFARGEAKAFPPVAGAVQEILERHGVSVDGKEVLVLGYGRLVGKPVSILLRHNHAHVTVIDKPVADLATHIRESDIVISGVGQPALITPDMLQPSAVLIDAGTSEQGGKIVGDAHPSCQDVVALFTPVPGGVGPVAIAMLFKNLLILARERHKE